MSFESWIFLFCNYFVLKSGVIVMYRLELKKERVENG